MLYSAQCHKDGRGLEGSTSCTDSPACRIVPLLHQLDVSLAPQLAALQAQRPAGASSSSSHGVGYSAAVPDPQRRIHRQHSDHHRGGGESDPG